jgi:DNA topoisomerase 2-associated protein PAT1
LDIEQLRREQASLNAEDPEAVEAWNERYSELVQQLWDNLRVMVPLETSNPHPFISLITPSKGKKLLPRISRHLSSQQMLTVLTLLVACFSQMDIVIHAGILDLPEETAQQQDLERQTQAFLGSVVQSILPVVAKAGLRLVSGLLGLLLERSDIVSVTQTRPGLAILTLFLSRVEVIKQSMSTAADLSELPTQEETEQWEMMFDHLFQLLHPNLLRLFPSTRIAAALATLPPNSAVPPMHTEALDQPVWQFLAALALHATNEQQQALVTSLREKVLENVASANKGWVADEDERRAKLGNVNLFLHALGLDSSQISI